MSKFDDLSDSLECFNLIMNELLDLLIPRKTLRVHNKNCPWLSTASLVRIHRLRDIAHRKALKSGSASDWLSYRTLRNKATSRLQSAKATNFHNLASSLRSKPEKFWRYFQCLFQEFF